jgi:hypothetical protein
LPHLFWFILPFWNSFGTTSGNIGLHIRTPRTYNPMHETCNILGFVGFDRCSDRGTKNADHFSAILTAQADLADLVSLVNTQFEFHFSAIFTAQTDLAEPISLVTTQFEFNKLVFVSLLNCVLVKIISRKLLSNCAWRHSQDSSFITFVWW